MSFIDKKIIKKYLVHPQVLSACKRKFNLIDKN